MSKDVEVLTKHEIAKRISDRLNISNVDAADILQAALDVMSEHLVNGGRIEIRNFGIFEPAIRNGGIGRNPRNPSQQIEIKPHRVVKFHLGKNLAKQIKGQK